MAQSLYTGCLMALSLYTGCLIALSLHRLFDGSVFTQAV